MTCEELAPLLHARSDGELGAADAARLERHLAACPACAAAAGRLEILRAAVRERATYHRLPALDRDALIRRLRAEVTPAVALAAHRPRRGIARRGAIAGGMAASLLVGLAVGGRLGREPAGPADRDPGEALVDAHLRALQPGRAIDVAASDRHVVKPWFDGRVDFSPPVLDLGEAGFALLGGRLDYVGQRTVAVIVYRRRQHQIDLFVWPVAPTERAAVARDFGGYGLRGWTQGGFRLNAVSNLAPDELDEFVRRWQEAQGASGG